MREVVTDELHVLSQPDSLDNSISLLGPKEAKDTVLVNMIWPQAVAGMPRVASSARCQDGTVFAGDVVLFSDERHKWSCGKVKCHLQYGEDRRTVLDRFQSERCTATMLSGMKEMIQWQCLCWRSSRVWFSPKMREHTRH